MYHGIINVYKEKGYTSHDVVAKLRGICKQKKIGHTGTLDPEAEGVLPVCLGKATKLCDLLTDKDKIYEACLVLGVATDTQDMTGKILEEKEVQVTEEEVRSCIDSFVGEYDQIPPMYSALKVNGKKLYEYAREGIEIERKSRKVTIFSIEIQKMELPRVWFQVQCSKGTYIRTLCHDIGEKLGCGGAMESLLRSKVSVFDIKDSLKLSEIESLRDKELLHQAVMPIDAMFLHLEQAVVKQEFSKLLYNGNHLYTHCFTKNDTKAKRIRVYDEPGHFIGIYEWSENRKLYEPVKLFLPID